MKGGDIEGGRTSGARRSRSAPSVLIPEDYVTDLQTPARSLPAPVDAGDARGDRCVRRRAGRPVRGAAGGGRPSARRHGDQGAVPAGGRIARRCRTEGRGHQAPQQRVRQPGRAGAAGGSLARAHQAAARSEARLPRRLGFAKNGSKVCAGSSPILPIWLARRRRLPEATTTVLLACGFTALTLYFYGRRTRPVSCAAPHPSPLPACGERRLVRCFFERWCVRLSDGAIRGRITAGGRVRCPGWWQDLGETRGARERSGPGCQIAAADLSVRRFR